MNNRQTMPTRAKTKRVKDFSEVALGFTKEQILLESNRCLQCKNAPCVTHCPVHVDIPKFIKRLKEDDIDAAYDIIYNDNMLPSICGRVCPQEKQCEGACVLGKKHKPIAIGALERYVGDYGNKSASLIDENNLQIAVIGSGPAGLSNAYNMRKLGYDVTLFEALHDFGGVLRYGIPDFRLPKSIVKREIDALKEIGVRFQKNTLVGRTITLDQLFEKGYKAVFIGSGAGLPRRLNIPGENNRGVYYANEFLTRVNLMQAHQFPHFKTPVHIGSRVAVIGGGNVAMDAARTAKRLGAKQVIVLYRRDMNGLPARKEEVDHAIEEGVEFKLLRNPVRFEGSNYTTTKVVCEKMVLGALDASNRPRPEPTNTFETLDIDSAIIAIGQSPNPILKRTTPTLETDQWGRIVTSDYQTNLPGVFAGGDIVSGAATVILAMGAGKNASYAMDTYIKQTNS